MSLETQDASGLSGDPLDSAGMMVRNDVIICYHIQTSPNYTGFPCNKESSQPVKGLGLRGFLLQGLSESMIWKDPARNSAIKDSTIAPITTSVPDVLQA